MKCNSISKDSGKNDLSKIFNNIFYDQRMEAIKLVIEYIPLHFLFTRILTKFIFNVNSYNKKVYEIPRFIGDGM